MSTTLTRPGNRLRRTLAGTLTTALAASTIALLPSSAQAAPATISTATGGTATWGLSTYLGSATMGRPNPLATAYVAPASFDAGTKLSTWGNATGTVAADGTASLAFAGTSVNFSKTGGAWLKLADVKAEIAPNGSGTVSALVSYGTAPGVFPAITFDPAQAPQRGPERVDLVDLSGNSAADRTLTPTTASWNGLDGVWSPDFLGFLAGDAAAVPAPIPGFIYSGQINNTATDRTVLPISFSVTRATAAITSATVIEQTPSSLKVAVAGTGYKAGSPGIYISVGETGNSNVTDDKQYLGTVWGSTDSGGNAGAAVQRDGSFATTLSLNADDIANLDPTKSYSVSTMKAHGQAATDASQSASTPLAINFGALGLKVASTPTVNGPASTYGKTRTVSVTIPQLGATAPTGSVTLSGGVTQTATLANGTATFTLPRTLSAGSRALTVSYSGDASYKASSATATLRINKANVTVKRNKIKKAPTSKKAGKTTLTVKSTTGGPAVTGKVKVTFKKGKKTKTKTVTIKNGKGNVTIPKLAKGTWKITVKFNGTSNFNKTATKKAGSVKVKK